MAFAELRMGTALGGLPHGAKVQITYGGRSVIAEKLDIGLGGPGCGGHSREIDLWYQTAQALGFNGLAPVTVTLPGESSRSDASLFLPGPPGSGPLGPVEVPLELGKEALEGKVPNPLNPLEQGANVLKALGNIPADFHKIYELLFTPKGWIRSGKVLVGIFLLLTGVLGMANVGNSTTINLGKKAAELAVVK